MTTNDANIHTVSVSVPDWLKERFDDGLAEYEADDYKKLAAVIKDNSSLSMTVTDLSDNTLDLAAADYCDDWYLLEPEQQQELRENIQDWIGALLVAGAISVSPQSKTEKPFWKPISECPKEDRKMYFIMMPDGFDEEVIKAYHLNKRRADQVRLAFKRTRAKEKQLTAPEDKSNWYFWGADEPYDKINENGPFETMNDAITDAKSKIRCRETVFIFKACWLRSDLNYHIFGFSRCEINSNEQAEEDDIFDKIEKRINDMSESEREAMQKSINMQEKMGQIFENATKHEEPVAFCDNSFFEGIEAAEKRITQVGKTKTLIEEMSDDVLDNWDRRNEDALVIDGSLDEDDE